MHLHRRRATLGAALLLVGCTEYDITSNFDPVANPDDPVAVCELTPTQVRPVHDSATFDGSESFDPGGLELTHEWVLVGKPEASTATFPAETGPIVSNFSADLAGEYVAELTVTNTDGNQDSCEAVLQAVPTENLWIELLWTHAGDDMDIHLLAPGGQLQTNLDCYYANCRSGLNWGDPDNPLNNPLLDYDDIPGTGPENINIAEPADGLYTVVVHDFPGSVYMPANPTTVNIYIDGQLVWSGTKDIEGEDDYVYFATIDWPSGQVNGL